MKRKVCPICNYDLEYRENMSYWKCKVCNTEIWPDERKIAEIEKEKSEKENKNREWEQLKWAVGNRSTSEVLPAGPPKLGGSRSRSRTKSRRSNKIKKDMPWLNDT